MATPRNVHQEGQVIVQDKNGYDRSERTGLAHLALFVCDHCALHRLGKAGLGYINTLTLGS